MLAKCRDLIIFNVETANDQQLDLAQKEYGKVAKVVARLAFLRDLVCRSTNEACVEALKQVNAEVDLDSNRLQAKIWRIKMDMIQETYGKADFNYQMFTVVIQDHFAEEKKKKEKIARRDHAQVEPPVKSRTMLERPAFRCAAYLLIVAFILVAFFGMSRYQPAMLESLRLTFAGGSRM